MSAGTQISTQEPIDGKAIKRAADLLSQQIWCWGQDVLRPEGNWLLEAGFDRLAAPADRERCSSVYSMELPHGRRVVLRGFGVFFGNDALGGVFLKRYEFRPLYTPRAELECPPWSSEDLPVLSRPAAAQQERATSLAVDLIGWIHAYEKNVGASLGVGYRQATLDRWKNSKRPVIPAKDMVGEWRSLSITVAESFHAAVF